MKTKLTFELLIVCMVFLFCNSGCNKDSSNPASSSISTGKGSDYFPISSGKILSATISGTATVYDSLGNATNLTQISNQTYNGSFGSSTIIRNMNSNPVFYYINNSSQLVGYLSNSNGDLVGFDQHSSNPIVTIIPSDISVGKEWIINPQSSPSQQVKVKIIESLNTYKNSVGITYQNVINLYITYKDSAGSTYYYDQNNYYKYYTKNVSDGNIYFAKGIGFVGAKLNNYDEIKKAYEKYNSNIYNYYQRTKVTGEMGTTN
jgi:hypothetical protein